MYFIRLGNQYIHDPRGHGTVAYDADCQTALNECGELTFTISPYHPLAGEIRGRDTSRPVVLEEDGTVIFEGFVWDVRETWSRELEITCKGSLAYLSDTLVRPYSTVENEAANTAPSSVDGLFSWYIQQHNSRCMEHQKFELGTNEGYMLDPNNYVYRASGQYPTTAAEIQAKLLDSLGGYLFVREGNPRTIDYLASCTDVNAQVIDFGVNLLDYAKTDSAGGIRTAIVPRGAIVDGSDVTLASLPDGGYDEFVKVGDTLYDPSAVQLHGWVEHPYDNPDIESAQALLEASMQQLRSIASPPVTIQIKAVDLALFEEGHKPLRSGQLVRVRSRAHGFDGYMLVNKITLDLNNPSGTVYTLGAAVPRLTGEQHAALSQINASIDAQTTAISGVRSEAAEANSTAAAAQAAVDGIIDYVVEELHTSAGGYRKWYSGRMEQWTRQSVTTTINTSFGGTYRNTPVITGESWLEAFSTIQHCITTCTADGGDMAWVGSASSATTAKADDVYLVRGASLTSSKTFIISSYGVGTWAGGHAMNNADETEY